LPLLIVATSANHDVSRILIDQGSSWYIMYEDLFLRLKIKMERLQPYVGGPLAAFDGSLTQPLGFFVLPTTFKNKGDPTSLRIIQVRFLVVLCTSGCNCILGRTSLKSLGAVPSTVHLKMRYHRTKNEVITMAVDKKGLKRYLWMTEETLSSTQQQNEDRTSFLHCPSTL
ncbi:hypothetical protein A2U01_0035657, partial [Trifolium medium]|nr:hypothetical protein [Trifolium medium]